MNPSGLSATNAKIIRCAHGPNRGGGPYYLCEKFHFEWQLMVDFRGPAKNYLQKLQYRLRETESVLISILPHITDTQLDSAMAVIREHRNNANSTSLRSMKMDLDYWDSYSLKSPSEIRRWESDQRTRIGISQTSMDESLRIPCSMAPAQPISSLEGQIFEQSNSYDQGLETDILEECGPLPPSRCAGTCQQMVRSQAEVRESRRDRDGQEAETAEGSWNRAASVDIQQLITTVSTRRRSLSTLRPSRKSEGETDVMEETYAHRQAAATDVMLTHNNESTEDLFW